MSHKIAEIAIREKFYISMELKTEALKSKPFDELLILATCNRTEFYVASDRALEEGELVRYICNLVQQDYEKFSQFFYTKESDEVAHHVMNVCAGLDSVAVGEDQILHQIGRAYETARQLQSTGNSLNKLFQGAIHTTKRIKTETNLNKLSCNIPFLAMKQVQKTFDDLENRSVFIVGLGEMGSLMLKYVQENTTKIFASSRTFSNAQKFADVLTPVPFEERYSVMGQVDVLILCSACHEPIVTKEHYEAQGSKIGGGKTLVIDLGNPRNAEASIGELDGVQYVCVDDLEKIVSENRRLRMIELEAAQKILHEGIKEFLQWYRMDDVAKMVNIQAERMMGMAKEETEKLLRSLPDLDSEQSEKVKMFFERFAKKMASDFLYKVKDKNSPEDVQMYLECLERGQA